MLVVPVTREVSIGPTADSLEPSVVMKRPSRRGEISVGTRSACLAVGPASLSNAKNARSVTVMLKLAFSFAAVLIVGLGMQLAKPSGMRLVDGTELDNVYGGECFKKIGSSCDGDPLLGCEETSCDLLAVWSCLRNRSVGTPCGNEACNVAWITTKCALPGGL